jgi:hypothetical protein
MRLAHRAFEVFDADHKGFVSEDDLGRYLSEVTGEDISNDEKHDMLQVLKNTVTKDKDESGKGELSLETFEDLVLSKLKVIQYKDGDLICNQGDEGSSMYFVNTGSVDVEIAGMGKVAMLQPGEFFGETSLLTGRRRNATVRAAKTGGKGTQVVEISRDDFKRFTQDAHNIVSSVRAVDEARSLERAKLAIGALAHVKSRTFKTDEHVFDEGDGGDSA